MAWLVGGGDPRTGVQEGRGAKVSRMEASIVPRISHGIMDEEEDELGTPSSSSSSGESTSSNDSSEFMDDATSSSSSSSSSPLPLENQKGALYQMSALMAQLPFKRGLSKHFHGKSQSFTSLSNARSLEDLAKTERPCRKKLKPSRSYGGGLDAHRAISKKPSRGGGALSSSLLARRQGFLGSSRPPVVPHRSSGFSAETLLFA